MTAARLSPAANLLRNSKLFALPPTVALPPTQPSSEPVASSDTASTIYPIRAAINTPLTSQGDWGLKRNLPTRSFAKTKTPVIRLQRGIDAPEHIADFESAGDHVLTLKKWQDVPLMIVPPTASQSRSSSRFENDRSVFHESFDNTTISSSQSNVGVGSSQPEMPAHLRHAQQKFLEEQNARSGMQQPHMDRIPQMKRPTYRWRYDGPWLAGMTNLEFDSYLEQFDADKTKRFRDHISQRIRDARLQSQAEQRADAIASGTAEEKRASMIAPESNSEQITDEEIADTIRSLRQNPDRFANEIASFLDLPEGPSQPAMNFSEDPRKTWRYDRENVGSVTYKESGPPRTHPSAGFSYTRSTQYGRMDADRGPLHPNLVVPARIMAPKGHNGPRARVNVGIGGLITAMTSPGIRVVADHWYPQPGGTRTSVKVRADKASVGPNGALEVVVEDARTTHKLDGSNMTREMGDPRVWDLPKRTPAGVQGTRATTEDGGVAYRKHTPPQALRTTTGAAAGQQDVSDFLQRMEQRSSQPR